MSYYKVTERLLAEKDIDVNLIRGRRRFEILSISLYHTATRLDTMLLRRLLAVLEIDPNLCVIGHSLISIAISYRYVSIVTCLLSIGSLDINGRGLIDPPIYRAVVYGYLDIVRLLV